MEVSPLRGAALGGCARFIRMPSWANGLKGAGGAGQELANAILGAGGHGGHIPGGGGGGGGCTSAKSVTCGRRPKVGGSAQLSACG